MSDQLSNVEQSPPATTCFKS